LFCFICRTTVSAARSLFFSDVTVLRVFCGLLLRTAEKRKRCDAEGDDDEFVSLETVRFAISVKIHAKMKKNRIS